MLLSARALHAESAAIRLELGDRRGIAEALEAFANVAFALGRPLQSGLHLGRSGYACGQTSDYRCRLASGHATKVAFKLRA